tara:strand:+ start:292 stop:1830 length:1539 start_codon:yes stop_codon:yes gene_type:complete
MIFISLNCWAPHYTTWNTLTNESWKITSPKSAPGTFAVNYSFDGEFLAVTFETPSKDRRDLIIEAYGSGGFAERAPSSIFIYQFDGSNWVQIDEIVQTNIYEELEVDIDLIIEDDLESSLLIHEDACDPGDDCIKISRDIGFAQDVIMKDGNLFVSHLSEAKIDIYQKSLSPSSNSYQWSIVNQISVPKTYFDDMSRFFGLRYNGQELILMQGTHVDSFTDTESIHPSGLLVFNKGESISDWSFIQKIEIPKATSDIATDYFDLGQDLLLLSNIGIDKVFLGDQSSTGDFEIVDEISSPHSPSCIGFGDGCDRFEFGKVVSLDDNQILITASRYRPDYFVGASGAAYVFEKTSDGSWLQKQFLTPDSWSDGTGEWGWDGDIQGDLIVINDCYFEFEPFNEVGRHYVFVKTPANEWEYLTALVVSSDMTSKFQLGAFGKLDISQSGLVFSSHASSSALRDTFEDVLYIYDFRDIEGLYLESLEAELPVISFGGLIMLGVSLLGLGFFKLNRNA